MVCRGTTTLVGLLVWFHDMLNISRILPLTIAVAWSALFGAYLGAPTLTSSKTKTFYGPPCAESHRLADNLMLSLHLRVIHATIVTVERYSTSSFHYLFVNLRRLLHTFMVRRRELLYFVRIPFTRTRTFRPGFNAAIGSRLVSAHTRSSASRVADGFGSGSETMRWRRVLAHAKRRNSDVGPLASTKAVCVITKSPRS